MNETRQSHTSTEQAAKNEIKLLKNQVKELNAQISVLQEELSHYEDGVQRLPLMSFIEYAEGYPPEQNEYARVVKEVLRDVYTSFTSEERMRLRALGHKSATMMGVTPHPLVPSERHVKNALEQLLQTTNAEGKRIFTLRYQWYAVWKVLQEYQYPANYQAFARTMQELLGTTNPPCDYESIRKIGNDVAGAANNLAYWKSCRDKADGKFKSLITVAITLTDLLAQE